MSGSWLALMMVAGQTAPAALPSPFPLPGTEWAMGLTVAELQQRIGGEGTFGDVTPPTGVRAGFVDYRTERCTVSFGLRAANDGVAPTVISIIAEEPGGSLMVFPEAAGCFASVRPETRPPAAPPVPPPDGQ